jgi:hypothetical protein
MNRPARSIEIFTMSALDLFVTAMGSFAILMMILFPYFRMEKEDKVLNTPANVLFCVWPTRLQDFEEFVKEVPDAKERGEVYRPDFFVQDDVWKKPGYEQQPDYPVVGAHQKGARERNHRAEGRISIADGRRMDRRRWPWPVLVGQQMAATAKFR